MGMSETSHDQHGPLDAPASKPRETPGAEASRAMAVATHRFQFPRVRETRRTTVSDELDATW